MREIYSIFVFLGVWICFCAIADYVLLIDKNALAMGWGVIAFLVAQSVQAWALKREVKP